MSGYIFDYRQELESDIWLLPPMYHRVWQYLKYKANHADGRIPNTDGTVTIIRAGQHATSYRHIAKGVGYYEGTKWKEPNPKTVKKILEWLVHEEMVAVQGNTKGTLVTIVNWELYQKELIQGNTKVTVKKHLVDTNKKNKEEYKKNKDKYLPDSYEYRVAEYLLTKIESRNPNHKKPNIQSWAKHIDYMVRIDKREVKEIGEVIDFCQSDPFWQNNILSTAKLREKYDQLVMKMKNPKKSNAPKMTTGMSAIQQYAQQLEERGEM